MILIVDIGNTRIKAAVFEQDRMVELVRTDKTDFRTNLFLILHKYPLISRMVVASVADSAEILQDLPVPVQYISRRSSFPFVNKYETPDTVGIDRLVLASGAVIRFPNMNRLVIDAGTCITYDFIDENDIYYGGAISPGIRLRYESLHAYTAKLPLLETGIPTHFIGTSTAQSIHSGVVNGAGNEIDGFIALYQAHAPNFIIILTGGDADFLAGRLKNTIFANSNFLIESLNQTFQFQSKND
ncbi:MAG TPA: type III pantothenate kinase [Flavobacterium sp.]|jgi:type III pantothenate kinase